MWEAEIWRIAVQGQPRQIVHEALSSKKMELEVWLKWYSGCFASAKP
jgi:hypothetical protein